MIIGPSVGTERVSLIKCMEEQLVVVAMVLRSITLAVFLIVVLILVSDGVTKDDMSVLEEITEFTNKKNVTYGLQSFQLAFATGLECCKDSWSR